MIRSYTTAEVAGIDAQAVDPVFQHFQSDLVVEVDIRNNFV